MTLNIPHICGSLPLDHPFPTPPLFIAAVILLHTSLSEGWNLISIMEGWFMILTHVFIVRWKRRRYCKSTTLSLQSNYLLFTMPQTLGRSRRGFCHGLHTRGFPQLFLYECRDILNTFYYCRGMDMNIWTLCIADSEPFHITVVHKTSGF
jgi:hypothetical protein